MAEEKDNAEEKDEGQPKRNAALLRLPFGLCKRMASRSRTVGRRETHGTP